MEKSSSRLPILYFIFMLLSGCVSVEDMTAAADARVQQAKSLLHAQSSCCQELESIDYRLLTTADRVELDFSPSSAKVRRFESGQSYIHGIKIPAMLNGENLFVRSHMSGGGRNKFPTIFVPTIQFLDGQYAPLNSAEEIPLCFHRGWMAPDVGYFGKIRVPEKAKFAIIYTDQKNLGQSVYYSSSGTTAGGGIVYESSFQYDFPRSVEGALDVWGLSNSSLEQTLNSKCWK